MKTTILSVILGLIFISCSRDNDEMINNGSKMLGKQEKKEEKILVTKITHEIDGKKRNSIYSYDGDKLKKIVSTDEGTGYYFTIDYQYSGGLIKSSNETDSRGRTENIEYTYNSDGQLEKSVSTEKRPSEDEAIIKIKKYTYNADVIVVDIEKLRKSGAGVQEQITSERYTYTYIDGRVTQLVEKYANNDETTTLFEYDGKNSPLMNVKGISALAIEFFGEGYNFIGSLRNNITSNSEMIKKAGSSELLKYDTKVEYEYTSHNYPAKIISKRGVAMETFVLTYNK